MNEEARQVMARERSLKRVKNATYVILAIAAVIAVYLYIDSIPPAAGKYDAFAQCIAKTETKFYGAYWCPHCAEQKREFGTAATYLPYIECSLPGGNGQTQVCIDNKIESYPTWEFPDKSRLTGTVSLAKLAEKTGCSLDVVTATSSTTAATDLSGVGSSSPAL